MPEDAATGRAGPDKAERRAARELVLAYHKEQLRGLLEHVRRGFVQLDAEEIDEFELDDLIHRYKKAATKLWAFCGGGRGSIVEAANALDYLRQRGQSPPDWWNEAARQDKA